MSAQHLIFTTLTVLALSIGQILFKLAARGFSSEAGLMQQFTGNPFLWSALLVYGLATGLWIALLRQLPLNVAYPFAALAFFFVPLLGHWFLDEPLRWQNMLGALVIMLGVWISVGLK